MRSWTRAFCSTILPTQKTFYLELLVVEVVGQDCLQSRLGKEPPKLRARPKAGANHRAQPQVATELHQALLDTGPPAPRALTSVKVIKII